MTIYLITKKHWDTENKNLTYISYRKEFWSVKKALDYIIVPRFLEFKKYKTLIMGNTLRIVIANGNYYEYVFERINLIQYLLYKFFRIEFITDSTEFILKKRFRS